MDCAHCEPVLLDLCYGELSAPVEREVRSHVSSCPICKKALARLESGQALAQNLPAETPSAESTARIMQLARAHVRRSPHSPLGRSWLSALARVAMTRQVAMATLSLLIVFVGLWSMPELTRRRDAGGLSPEAEEADPARARQAHLSQPSAAAPSAAEAAPAAGQPHAEERAARRKHDAPAARSRARPESGAQNARAEAKPRERSEPSRFAAEPPASPATSAAASPARQLAEAEPAPAPAERRAASSSADADEPLAAPAPALETAAAADSSGSSVASLEAVFKAGLERYRSGDYVAAVQLLSRMLESSAPSGQRAPALLYLARSERALGRCDRAIRAYETLVRSYGSAQQSLAAMLEGVECYDRLGEPMAAQRLLEHALSVPSLAAQATRALQERGVPPR